MRKKFLSALLLCCMVLTLLPTAALADGDVAINEANFPDENFREYIKNEFDKDNDESLSADEIGAVQDISVTGQSITSIKGIEHFTALETLFVGSPITTLDVSKNTALTSLRCSDTKLTSLDTSHNTKLRTLECNETPTLTSLNVSGNTELRFLYCKRNALTDLDLTTNLKLEKLECGGNEFTTLDLSRNTSLKYFGFSNGKLSSLDLTHNTNLEELYFFGSNFSTIDVSKNTKLRILRLFDNRLMITLDTSKNSILQELDVQRNPLTSMYLGDASGSTMEVKFDNKPYPIEVSAAEKTFDLNTLPGFDVSKASDWKNGTVDGNILTVKEGVENVTYTYDCGERQATYGTPAETRKLVMPCTLKINWQNADGPAAPVLELDSRFANSIFVKKLGDGYEYRINDGDWQNLHYFSDLQPGTEYTITARAKGTATHEPGAVSDPLKVTTLYDKIPDDLRDKLGAVVRAYIAEYDGMEHEAVIVDMDKMPEGWYIAGYDTGKGTSFGSQKPMIRNVSDSSLTARTKFAHPDYGQSLFVYSYPKVTPKPLTNDMIANIPNQLYTGQQLQPKPEIKDGNMDLVEGRDFAYSYGENTTVSGTVNITGMGNYKDTASKSFSIVNEITEITEDDLKDLEIPTLVTVKCTTTNSSKAYGRIPGGFDLSKTELSMEGDVRKAIVHLDLLAYKAKYDADTNKTHTYTDLQGNLVTTLTLKYVDGKWQPEGILPNLTLLVKCDDGHHKPNKPTVPEDTTVPSTAVKVLCTTAADQQQSARHYGLLPGGFTATEPMEKEGKYECLITLNPETYRQKYSEDTGILHSLDDSQPMGDLQIKLVYDRGSGKWMPVHELYTPLMIYVKCDNHQEQYTITFDGNGGTPSVDSMKTVDKKLPQLPKATHSGRYSFDGWYTAASGGAMITTDTEFDKNTTVYAHWTYTGSSGGSSSGRTYHTIKASSDSNGSISPSERVSVRHGRDQSFTITPDKGYEIAKVLVDGKSVGAVESYTFKNVTKNHTIEAIFMKTNDKPMPDTFMDVPNGSYYEKAVDWAVKNGITAGTGDNYFMPDGICTRAQAVTFLWRVAGSPTSKTEVMPFEDVPEGSYYYEAVLWAAENEITVGTSATTFSPELTCSRAHIVSFLWRAAGYPSAGTVNPFTDVPENAYYINAMLWAVKQEITVGTTPSTFSPDEGCTRAQIVTFLYRARSM